MGRAKVHEQRTLGRLVPVASKGGVADPSQWRQVDSEHQRQSSRSKSRGLCLAHLRQGGLDVLEQTSGWPVYIG